MPDGPERYLSFSAMSFLEDNDKEKKFSELAVDQQVWVAGMDNHEKMALQQTCSTIMLSEGETDVLITPL
jgi:hypothetical protein